MQVDTDVIIVGAGACGLMAALELSKRGMKVIVLEARDRIGGRIFPLPEKEFSYPIQGGAEFVHGKSPITKRILKEAGISITTMEGKQWNPIERRVVSMNEFGEGWKVPAKKLKSLKKDIPVSKFLERYLSGEEYAQLRNSVIQMVDGYDAADPKRISTFYVREEWLGEKTFVQYRVKEGYGKMLKHIEAKCKAKGVKIILKSEVVAVDARYDIIRVSCKYRKYLCRKVLVTVPLPIIKEIRFSPQIGEKISAASKIGYGSIIKVVLRFKDRWWIDAAAKNIREVDFIFSDQPVGTWWTQYPSKVPILTGWIPSSISSKISSKPTKYILGLSLKSLSAIFDVELNLVKSMLVVSRVINWPADRFSRGAYSYPTVNAEKFAEIIKRPVNGRLFFAGEALYSGNETSTVEGALGSGIEVATQMMAPNMP